ncbi:MAG: aminodeoxychorismate synthase component I [Ignavibacteria bacterium]|nr:aminodeoxychorismate synthase component I [Ignavibacteria bacterium]
MIKLLDILNRVLSNSYSAFFYSPLKRGDEESYLCLEPERIHVIKNIENVDEFLSVLDEINEKKLFAYTLLPYELGLLFEKKLRKILTKKDERTILENAIIVTFNKKNAKRIKTSNINFSGMEKANFNVSNFKLNESRKSFSNKIEDIKMQIAEGETYQVNLTSSATFNFNESVEGLFYNLLLKQSAEYSAFINLPDKTILSFSPELFYKLEGKSVTAKPMKGTAFRGINLQEDLRNEEELFLSEKNRAENLMIVDLLRNDLGKISKQNSVSVKKLFEVEKYESLFQMVSIIKSRLKDHIKLSDLIKNIFPCGSITGAPKIRTMEIIHRLEKHQRGIYTGSIGLLLPEKSIFNIAIRTVEIDKANKTGSIGLGAGITWGSKADEEYEEVLIKGAFVTQPPNQFEIFTSLLYENGKPFLLKEHLKRLKCSAEYFLFYFDREKVEKELSKCFKALSDKKRYKIKVSLNKFDKITVKASELTSSSVNAARVVISPLKIDEKNRFQYFKTTNRAIYDSELLKYQQEGFDEVLFLNKRDKLAEGAITNIFIHADGRWKTPSLSSGILNGIYRNYFIKNHDVLEDVLSISDLKKADKIILTNAVRKVINIGEIVLNGKTIFTAK